MIDTLDKLVSLRVILSPWLKVASTTAFITLLTSCGTVDPQHYITISDTTLIDAKHGVRKHQSVVLQGDEILAIGPSDQVAERGAVIDGSGRFLIPGLWDMHVHLTYDDRVTDVMPEAFIEYGVTSVRDTGGLLHKIAPLVDQIVAADTPSPRIFYSGPLLDGSTPIYNGDSVPEIGIPNATAAEARSNVERLINRGASFVKIYELVDPKIFKALVSAADEFDVPVAIHVPLSMLASEAGPMADSMEHVRNVEFDCAENYEALRIERLELLNNSSDLAPIALRRQIHGSQRVRALDRFDAERCKFVLTSLRDTIQVPTASLNRLFLEPSFERDDYAAALQRLPDSVQEEWQIVPTWIEPDPAKRQSPVADFTRSIVGMMHEAGVPIGAGTDTPIGRAIPGYSLHHELEVLVDSGLPPIEAIRSATIRPAEFFDLDDEMGAIEVGMRADLLLLSKNPLDNIQNTRSIQTVISRGEIVFTDNTESAGNQVDTLFGGQT